MDLDACVGDLTCVERTHSKLWGTSALLLFCLAITTGCVCMRAEGESRFQRVELREANVRIYGLTFPATYTYRLTENEVIAFGFDTSTTVGPGWVAILLDRDSKQVIFRSEIYDTPYEWWLSIYRAGSYAFILWELEIENYTLLPLFVFDTKSRTCSYAGEFEVMQYFDEVVDYAPYHIEGIEIEASDTLVSFKFTKKLRLLESDTSSRVADSLTYELDLRSDSLRVAKIWASDTLR